LGNSPLMVATVYVKWISGDADKAEMAKLNTAVIESKIRIGAKLAHEDLDGPQLFDFEEGRMVGTAGFELVQ